MAAAVHGLGTVLVAAAVHGLGASWLRLCIAALEHSHAWLCIGYMYAAVARFPGQPLQCVV